MKEIKTFVDQKMLNNTYVLVNDKEALIIDPSFSSEKLEDYIIENDLDVIAILLTHGHYDHFAGLEVLGNTYNCPYYISEEDEDFLYDKSKSYAVKLPKQKPELYPNNVFIIGNFELKTIKTPGHTPGSVIIVWHNNMFTGDFIFAKDIGRTDLKGSNPRAMENSLRELAKIEGDYNIYPGHEESSTLAEEKKYNSYLNLYVK